MILSFTVGITSAIALDYYIHTDLTLLIAIYSSLFSLMGFLQTSVFWSYSFKYLYVSQLLLNLEKAEA